MYRGCDCRGVPGDRWFFWLHIKFNFEVNLPFGKVLNQYSTVHRRQQRVQRMRRSFYRFCRESKVTVKAHLLGAIRT
jgi:hypothetical protein